MDWSPSIDWLFSDSCTAWSVATEDVSSISLESLIEESSVIEFEGCTWSELNESPPFEQSILESSKLFRSVVLSEVFKLSLFSFLIHVVGFSNRLHTSGMKIFEYSNDTLS